MLEAALALPPEDRAKPMGVSHESIANTLAHIYFGDAIWFSRIADPGYPVPPQRSLNGPTDNARHLPFSGYTLQVRYYSRSALPKRLIRGSLHD